MSEQKIPIPAMLYNAAVGGHVTNSQQIIDENENKEQSQINSEIKQALGQGGSVAASINQAKTDIIGGASSNGNTLKKLEDRVSPLESAVDTGGSVDSRISNAVATETTRAQTAEEQLRTLYNNLQQSQPIPVTELPATGEAGKIYRLAGTTSYADYMYAEGALTTSIKMAEYDNAIDDEPTAGSGNLVKSSGIMDAINNGYVLPSNFVPSTANFAPYEGKTIIIDHYMSDWQHTVTFPNNITVIFKGDGLLEVGNLASYITDINDIANAPYFVFEKPDKQYIKYVSNYTNTYFRSNLFSNHIYVASGGNLPSNTDVVKYFVTKVLYLTDYDYNYFTTENLVPIFDGIGEIKSVKESGLIGTIVLNQTTYIKNTVIKTSANNICAITFNGDNNIIENCDFENVFIILNGKNNIIRNCNFNISTNTVYAYIAINNDCNTIIGNTLHNISIAYNIVIRKGKNHIIKDNRIFGGVTGIMLRPNNPEPIAEKTIENTLISDNIINVKEEGISLDITGITPGFANMTLLSINDSIYSFRINNIKLGIEYNDLVGCIVYGILKTNNYYYMKLGDISSIEDNIVSFNKSDDNIIFMEDTAINGLFGCGFTCYGIDIINNIINKGTLYYSGNIIKCNIINNIVRTSLYGGMANLAGYVNNNVDIRYSKIYINIKGNICSEEFHFLADQDVKSIETAVNDNLISAADAANISRTEQNYWIVTSNSIMSDKTYLHSVDNSICDVLSFRKKTQDSKKNQNQFLDCKNISHLCYLADSSDLENNNLQGLIFSRSHNLIYVDGNKLKVHTGTDDNQYSENVTFVDIE